jgi:hypothetical protein
VHPGRVRAAACRIYGQNGEFVDQVRGIVIGPVHPLRNLASNVGGTALIVMKVARHAPFVVDRVARI